jgi:hypothetical protein
MKRYRHDVCQNAHKNERLEIHFAGRGTSRGETLKHRTELALQVSSEDSLVPAEQNPAEKVSHRSP